MKKDATPLLKGMIKQSSDKQQPKGSWNFALNALFGSWDGDAASVTNEVGNEVCVQVVDKYTDPSSPSNEDNFTLIGASILPDNNFVLFFVNSDPTPITIIGIHDAINCDFEVLVKTDCLGLYPHRQLNIRTRIIKGCERVVYFTDKVTSYRAINLDELVQYLAIDTAGDGLPIHNLDHSDPFYANLAANYSAAWNCVKFNHFLPFLPGCIELQDIRDAGGNIPAGAHQFAMRYLDADLNPTNFTPLSSPIFIYLENPNSSAADGEPVGTITTKSIKFKLTGLDPTFAFVQLAVASAIQGTASIDEVFILDNIPIFTIAGVTEATYTYFGFDPIVHIVSTLKEITVPTIPFEGVIAHEIIDNRLLLANVSNPNEDFAALQRATLMAKTKWRMYQDYELDPNSIDPEADNATKNSLILFDRKTLMRDEVYSLGVIYLLDDGSELPTMHIPGRPRNEDFDGTNIVTYTTPNIKNRHNTRGNTFASFATDWDTKSLDITFDAEMTSGDENLKVAHSNVTYLLDELLTCGGPVTANPITISFETTDNGGGSGTFAFTSMGAGDKALVRITILGAGKTDLAVESFFGFLTSASPSLNFIYGVAATEMISYQVFYYDASAGPTGKSYHEITAGGPLAKQFGAFPDMILNECKYEFDALCTVERWKVHNTFVVTGTTGDPVTEGYMGYHENQNCYYPRVLDCDGVAVFNASDLEYTNGNPGPILNGTNIRHHRIPDCGGDASNFDFNTNEMGLTKRDWVDSTGVSFGGIGALKRKIALNKIGLVVDMTDVYSNIPLELRDRIVGHYIVYGKRTEQNKTVLDKGYLWRNHYLADFAYQMFINGDIDYYSMWFEFKDLDAGTLDTSGINTYDDLDSVDATAVSPAIPGGRVDQISRQMAQAFRASISYTTGLVTYLGYGYGTFLTTNIGDSTGFHGTEKNFSEYVSPTTVFDQSIPTADYIKIECPISSYHPTTAILESEYELMNVGQFGLELGGHAAGREDKFDTYLHADFNHIATHVNQYSGFVNSLVPTDMAYLGFHRKLIGAAIIPANTIATASQFTVPTTVSADAHGQVSTFYQTELPFPQVMSPGLSKFSDIFRGFDTTGLPSVQAILEDNNMSNYYVAIKNHKDVFCSLESIIYQRLHICFIPQDPGTYDSIITGGDTFITKLRDVKTWSLWTTTRIGNTGGDSAFGRSKAYAVSMEGFCETDKINCALAFSSVPESNYAEKYFTRIQYLHIGHTKPSFNREILWNDIAMDDTSDMAALVGGFGYKEFKFQYNKDFGKNHKESPGFPLSDTYNYCDECAGSEPNSIYYSIKGFSEDAFDNFKIILANNKFNVPSESGDITNLFLEKDQLYAHTTKALFSIQTRPQELNSSAATIQVGTGEIGSIPPKKLISVQYGYGGSDDAFATIGTQYGTFFVDADSGRVFLFSKGLNEISKKGMEQWFHDNLPIKFREQFYQLTSTFLPIEAGGVEYPVRDTANNNAVGLQAVYDSRLNRIILHKKDHTIRETNDAGDSIEVFPSIFKSLAALQLFAPVGIPNYLFIIKDEFDYVTWYYWDTIGAVYVPTTLLDVAWFINESWTLSYSLDGNFWVSFHSYQPNFMYNGNSNVYTFINRVDNGTVTWKHVERNYQTYYGTKYDHILDISISNAGAEKVSHSIQFINNVYLYNSTSEASNKIENITFDRFYAYNSKQASTQRDLIVKIPNSYQDITLPLTQTLMDRTENYWRFNRFRDEITDRTIPYFTSDWEDLQVFFDAEGQGYIDGVLDPLAIDGTRGIYQQARFRDKFFAVRMFFNDPTEDYKIVTEVMSFLTHTSLR